MKAEEEADCYRAQTMASQAQSQDNANTWQYEMDLMVQDEWVQERLEKRMQGLPSPKNTRRPAKNKK